MSWVFHHRKTHSLFLWQESLITYKSNRHSSLTQDMNFTLTFVPQSLIPIVFHSTRSHLNRHTDQTENTAWVFSSMTTGFFISDRDWHTSRYCFSFLIFILILILEGFLCQMSWLTQRIQWHLMSDDKIRRVYMGILQYSCFARTCDVFYDNIFLPLSLSLSLSLSWNPVKVTSQQVVREVNQINLN